MTQDPESLRAAAWQAMARGVADRHHPARVPSLATIGADGPTIRTVVLRGWQDGLAEIHTDAASAKADELRADPRAALHVWVPRQKLQIRLQGLVAVSVAESAIWARVPEAARRVYGGQPEPGGALDAPEAFRAEPALARFAVLRFSTASADLLDLGGDPHRRALFRREGAGWTGQWIAP